MKKRMLILCVAVVLCVTGWRSGYLGALLQQMGTWAAMSAVSRTLVAGDTVRLETGQGYEEGLLLTLPKEQAADSKSEAPVVDLGINNGKNKVIQNVAIKNGTSKEVDIASLLSKGFTKPTLSSDAPAVLIYHTHTTESYADAGKAYSSEGDKGVIGVGEQMKAVFESHGLKTIHLTDNYIDGGAFKKAYTRSLAGVQAVLKKYPSIQIVLDVHRDSITEGNIEYAPLTEIEGEQFAQVMVICGTNELGLGHPDWQKNLRFGLSLVSRLQKDYPGLARPLNLNPNRYNTHTTPYALLVEVGGGANTSAQAKRSGRALAEGICKIVI